MNTISVNQAQTMETNGEIIIYHTGNTVSRLHKNPNYLSWRNEFNELSHTYRKIPKGKLIEFLDFDYKIEYKQEFKGDAPQTIWTYMYGKTKESALKLKQSTTKGKYVYILTNEAYPNFCKIGKAIMPSSRVKQINNAGVVSEWQLRWSLPVSNDYAVENIVHQCLEHLRKGTHQGSKREFIEISLEEAISTIERLGQFFKTGEGIYNE